MVSLGPDAPVRILVVDDHPIVRLGIREMVAAYSAGWVCVEADSPLDALRLAQHAEVDVALVDLELERGTGLALVRALHRVVPSLPVLVLSARDEVLWAERVLKAGARGYVMKREPVEHLIEAIRQVRSGRTYRSPSLSERVVERAPRAGVADDRLQTLTDRELQVLQLIGRGLSTAMIADRLGLSIKTIETYRSNIKTKLGLKGATELLRYATIFGEGV